MNDLFRIPLDFPDAPALNDEFTASNGATYRWDGTVWMPIGTLDPGGVYLPLAGGTMAGPLVLAQNPVIAMDAATKLYVDTIATGARLIIGIINGTNGRCVYSGASGLPPGPLVDASTVQSGSDVICTVAGTIPPDPLLPAEVWNMTLAVGDVLVSNGANWILVHIPRVTVTAAQVAVIPPVFGSNTVQDALTQAALQDMPPGGAVGQILTKRAGADYDTEWTDASDPVNYTNIFMNRTPGGSGAVDPNQFPIGSQSIWMNSAPVNCPPMSAGNTVQGFWQINTYMSGATGLQQAIEHTNPSPGPSTILSMWIRPRGNLQTTWGPWVQQSISNSDGAFVRLTGDTMTGPLQIAAPLAGENQAGGPLQINGRLELVSAAGGTFRYVNRNNDQGGLTYVSSGVPTYVDWLIWNANNNGLSINNPNGTGINIINGSATITGDMSATAGSFAGPVTEPIAPTQDNHLANKAYVDRAITASRLIIGGIDAATGLCVYTNSSGLVNGPLVPAAATQAGAYLLCDNPGTIPGNAPPEVQGIDMALLDMLLSDGTEWHHFATGQGGTITLASQCQLIPNVAGAANAQTGMETLQAQKVAKTGDAMTGAFTWASTLGVGPPNAAGNSAGNRLQLWNSTGAPGFGLGIESGAMWLNATTNTNLFKLYFGAVEKFRFFQNGWDLRHDGMKGINFLRANGTARWWINTSDGNDDRFSIAAQTNAGGSYSYFHIDRQSGRATIPYGITGMLSITNGISVPSGNVHVDAGNVWVKGQGTFNNTTASNVWNQKQLIVSYAAGPANGPSAPASTWGEAGMSFYNYNPSNQGGLRKSVILLNHLDVGGYNQIRVVDGDNNNLCRFAARNHDTSVLLNSPLAAYAEPGPAQASAKRGEVEVDLVKVVKSLVTKVYALEAQIARMSA